MNEDQLNYVKKQLEAGQSEVEIRQSLQSAGYQPELINSLFTSINASSGQSAPPPPVPTYSGSSTVPPAGDMSKSAQVSDTDNVKLFGILGYVLPVLFFLPLVTEGSKQNTFSRFHSNQQCILFIFWVIITFVIPQLLGFVFSLAVAYAFIMPLLNLFAFVLAILGIVNVMQNKMKPLPLLGSITIIK